ncbi:MAG TPA: DMT family transporter [Mariprofundaceae bacterium]|nr:DMT family transporter [Mariprofundaceae bacterium]
MSVPMAYLGVIVVWSTTPLAILWSSQGVGFVFGVTSRMVIGAVVALMLTALLGLGMKWHRRALQAYAAAGLGIYGAMLATYWSAQFIPSGWIAVIFGLSPVVTGLLASLWLEGERLTLSRLAGMALGLAGLVVIFGSSLSLNGKAVFGVVGILLAATIQSASAIWVKRIDAAVPAIVMTSGGLAVAAPLFLVTWLVSGSGLPHDIPARTLGAIGYLALFGSVIGFALYFYVLRHVEATRVSLITLVTPVMALLLGSMLNGEAVTAAVLSGATLILSGLALFELGGRLGRLRGLRKRV